MQNKSIELNIRSKSNSELYLILNHSSEEYSTEAIAIAKDEYNNRNCSEEEILSHREQLSKIKMNETLLADQSATIFEKAVYFLFPGILMLLFASEFERKGLKRKHETLKRCSKYGIVFYVILILMALIASTF